MIERACQFLLSQLSDYLDGDLEAALCTELERHLASCENCRVVVNTLEKMITLYHHLPDPDLPAETQDRLFKVLRLDAYRQ